MWYSAVGCIVTLLLSLLAAPLAADTQPPAKVARIGYLLGATRPPEPFLEEFLAAMRARLCRRPAPCHGVPRGGRAVRAPPGPRARVVRLPVDILLVMNTPAALAA